jgi:hypothetical protein
MPKEVITRVDQLGKAEGQPKLLTFYNRKGRLIGEYTEDDTEIPAVPPENEIPGVHPENEIPGVQHAIPGVDHETTGVEMDRQEEEFEEEEQFGLEIPPDQEDNNEPEMLEQPDAPVHEQANDNAEQPDAQVQDPTPLRRSTRDRKPVQRLDTKISGKRHAEVTLSMVNTIQDIEPDWDIVTFKCMTRLFMKAGLKRFGKQGEDAVSKELNQRHLRDTFEPVDSTELSTEERKRGRASWSLICSSSTRKMLQSRVEW